MLIQRRHALDLRGKTIDDPKAKKLKPVRPRVTVEPDQPPVSDRMIDLCDVHGLDRHSADPDERYSELAHWESVSVDDRCSINVRRIAKARAAAIRRSIS